MQQEYLQIGEIVRPQGIRGEVKLRAMTEVDALFLTEKEINNLFQNCILLDS